MAKINISKAEIEKMFKDQLGCSKVTWNKSGNAIVEMDLDKIKKKSVYYHNPFTITSVPDRWTWTGTTTTGSGTTTLEYIGDTTTS